MPQTGLIDVLITFILVYCMELLPRFDLASYYDNARRLKRPYESLSVLVALADGFAAHPAEFQVCQHWFGIVHGADWLIA